MSEPTKTFKEAFCEHYHVAPERFIRAAVFKCLHADAGFLFRILYALQARTTQESVRFIELVGRTRTDEELEDLISDYHNDVADRSTFLARGMNQRVSARKVAQIHQIIRGRQGGGAHDSTHFYQREKAKQL